MIGLVIVEELKNVFYQLRGPDSGHEHTAAEEAEIIQKFKVRQKQQGWLVAPTLAIVIGLISRKQIISKFGWDPLNIFTVSIGLAALLFSLFNCRCPACNHYLGKYGFHRKYCCRCGARLKG